MIVYITQCLKTVWWIRCIGTQNIESLPPPKKKMFFKNAVMASSWEKQTDGQAHCIYSNHRNKYKHKEFTSGIGVKSVKSIFHLLGTDTEVRRGKSRFFFLEASFSNLGSVSSYRNTFVVWRSGSQSVLAYPKVSVTSSQRIRVYISIMATLKFIYFLIKRIMFC